MGISRFSRDRAPRLATVLTSPPPGGRCPLFVQAPLELLSLSSARRRVPWKDVERRYCVLPAISGPACLPWIIQRARSCRFANADGTSIRVSPNFSTIARKLNYCRGRLARVVSEDENKFEIRAIFLHAGLRNGVQVSAFNSLKHGKRIQVLRRVSIEVGRGERERERERETGRNARQHPPYRGKTGRASHL